VQTYYGAGGLPRGVSRDLVSLPKPVSACIVAGRDRFCRGVACIIVIIIIVIGGVALSPAGKARRAGTLKTRRGVEGA